LTEEATDGMIGMRRPTSDRDHWYPMHLPQACVLIVDDDLSTSAALDGHLRQRGYDVRTAAQALDMVRSLAGWAPDVAIADPAAGGGSGMAAIEALAALSRPPMLIAFLRPDPSATISRTKLALFDQAFSKAASPEAIEEAIARHFARKTIRLE
jgi:DNA-binding NarL/FixJ family response regulator